jgi:hypothetical protein
MDESRGGRRVDEPDDEPDGDPGEGAEDGRDEDEHQRRALEQLPEGRVGALREPRLGQGHDDPAADGEVRHDDVKNGDDADQDASANRDIPDRVVHRDLRSDSPAPGP